MNTTVPTYALYGESGREPPPDFLHCESIPQRSSLYDWEISPHRHDLFMQILYIRSGTADIQFEQRRFRIHGPGLLFVPPRCIHGFRFSQDVDGAVVTVVTHQIEALLARQPELRPCFADPQHIELSRSSRSFERIAHTLEQLLDEYDDFSTWRIAMLESLLNSTLILLAREIGALTRQDAEGGARRGRHHAQRFMALINQYFRERRDLAFYADQLGITGTQLNRVCRQELGRSALGAINDRLIMAARRDLAYSSLSVKEIAWTLGFVDAGYFSRFFTKQTGTPPTDFRIMARRELDTRAAA